MSEVRRQSIISTLFVYAGFLIGFINTWLFTRQGSPFSPSEYAMTGIFMAVGNLMYAFANMGTVSVVYKFYPYYNDNLPRKKNDLLTWSFMISTLGFVLVIVAGMVFKDVVVRKFGGNSPLFLQYYKWTFPFGFGILIFTLLEAFGWGIRRPIFTTFLREMFFKILVLSLIIFWSFKLIADFDIFIKLYAFAYLATAAVLFIFLIRHRAFNLYFSVSRVTRKFYKKMISMATLTYSSAVVFMIAQFADTLIIMSLLGTEAAGIFILGSVVSGLVQAPQRGAVAASTAVLAKAWKDKDLGKISTIYSRSAINLLIASLGIFFLIWLSYEDIVMTFNLKTVYLDSLWIFFFFGLGRVVDLGTGLNAQIIATSTFWRFEFVSGIILLVVIVPLDYILVKEFGIIGAGYANLISLTLYNIIRVVFLKMKFNMFPFGKKTLAIILIATAVYFVCHFAFAHIDGLPGILLRSLLFIALFCGAVLFFRLTPDAMPVLRTVYDRMRKRR